MNTTNARITTETSIILTSSHKENGLSSRIR